MQDLTMSITFIGDNTADNVAIIEALSGARFSRDDTEKDASKIVNFKYPINSKYSLDFFLIEPGKHPNSLHIATDVFNVPMVCIVVDAADTTQKQCEDILRYQEFIRTSTTAERALMKEHNKDYKEKMPVVAVLAYKKSDAENRLTSEALARCSLKETDYITMSPNDLTHGIKPWAEFLIAKHLAATSVAIDNSRFTSATAAATVFTPSTAAPNASLFRPASPERSATAAASVSTLSEAPRQPMR